MTQTLKPKEKIPYTPNTDKEVMTPKTPATNAYISDWGILPTLRRWPG